MEIIRRVTTLQQAIAFAFDDGPNPIYTPQLLDIFEAVSGHATFFMTGNKSNFIPRPLWMSMSGNMKLGTILTPILI